MTNTDENKPEETTPYAAAEAEKPAAETAPPAEEEKPAESEA